MLVHYHSQEMLALFGEHATPESLIAQPRAQAGLRRRGHRPYRRHRRPGPVGDSSAPRDDQAAVCEDARDRRVTNLFVAVDLIGRGIGRRLLDHLVRLAEAEGAQRLHAASSRNAVSFYERAGFVVDPDPPTDMPEITWLLRRLPTD